MQQVRGLTSRPSAEELIAAHQRDVWRFLMALGCRAEDADDLTQETFLNLLRADFTYEGPAQTAAWLRRAAKNLFISAIRRRKLALLAPNFDDADTDWNTFVQQAEGDERVQLLRECMQALEDRARRALELRYRLDASREAIGRELGIAESGVKSLLERLRERLKECVLRKLARDQ